jgi:DNA-binding XRE family transcriptional regulator
MSKNTDNLKRLTGQHHNTSAESVHDTISRLRLSKVRLSNTYSLAKDQSTNSTSQIVRVKNRTPKNTQPIPASERKHKINQVIKLLLIGELTQGLALKELRIGVLGVKQDTYAKMVGVSRKTISEIENDRGAFKTDILDKVFKPFGLRVGLVPTSTNILNSVLSTFDE